MSRLGLSEDTIRSVMMTQRHRAPCLQLRLLLGGGAASVLGPNWREHTCLSGGASGTLAGRGAREQIVH